MTVLHPEEAQIIRTLLRSCSVQTLVTLQTNLHNEPESLIKELVTENRRTGYSDYKSHARAFDVVKILSGELTSISQNLSY